ncbi:MAG: hypothetical protein Athens041674_65, partial [Parcubacteria group bacterium Athens0416_74]
MPAIRALFEECVEVQHACYTARVLSNPMTLRPLHNLLRLYAGLTASHPSFMRLARFVISGGTATAVNLGTLFVLTHFFGVWYIYSSIAAFAVSFFVSFSLQKLWTFGDTALDKVHVQATKFLAVILVALGINTMLIYAFVEYMHAHYLLGQLVSGLFIAVINYFSYKHIVFSQSHTDSIAPAATPRERMSYFQVAMLLAAVLLFTFLALFRLSENPPTWMDEGVIDQISINIAAYGIYGIQTAPDTFTSANFMTTSFPVFYPVAASFALFGTTLLNARIVMFAFMALLCVTGYFLIQSVARERKYSLALFSLFLLVTFAPLYGHGKNVLGEVPGLLFFVASLLALSYAQRATQFRPWLVSGTLLGLSMVTKPLYLLILLPTTLVMYVVMYRRVSFVNMVAFGLGVTAMLVLWFFLHVTSIAVLKEILFAANTNNVALSTRILENASQFISQLQPIYFFGLLAVWWGSLLLRLRGSIKISDAELFAAVFSVMNLLMYLASRGFYRYFFPAEVLALLFLPHALYETPLTNNPFLVRSLDLELEKI